MGQEWYYAKGKEKRGPISEVDLKKIAASGQLNPTDLVWKEGMAQWTEAKKIRGLFPANEQRPALSTAPVPPALPDTSGQVDGLPSAAPPLWNPRAAQLWSLLFSWAFGSYLYAQNWRALGNSARASRCMIWFYSFIPWLLLAFVTPDTPLLTNFFRYGSLLIFCIWSVVEAKPHIKLVNERFGVHYPRRPWQLPLGIASASLVVVVVGFFLFSGESAELFSGESAEVKLVKNGNLSAYPGVPVGKAIDRFLSKPRWSSGTDKDGRHFVNVEGGMTFQEKPVRALIQFLVDKEKGSFEFYAFEINGVPQNNLMKIGLMKKIFEEYKK